MKKTMRWHFAVLLALWCGLAGWAGAETYNSYVLIDGRIISARPTGVYKDAFLQLKLENGVYTNYSWGLFSANSLMELAKDKKAAPLAAAFLLDPPPMNPPKADKKDNNPPETWQPKPAERMERPARGSLTGSPIMVGLLVLMYLANLYAGYAVSMFRQQPLLLVCGLTAVMPVIVPVVFLALPTREPPEEEEEVVETPVEGTPEATAPASSAPGAPGSTPPPIPASAASALPATVLYQRGQTTFNRRFFETKFAGFMKMVPGEAEKDLLIVVESARGAHACSRVAKIQPNELVLHVVKGTASEDVSIPYGEITLVKVKHKDSPD